MRMGRNPLFDGEAKRWEGLYLRGGGERWGIFQGNVRARTVARNAVGTVWPSTAVWISASVTVTFCAPSATLRFPTPDV